MTELPSAQSLIRLLQITSPSLPVGAYSYSQGLEWAVEGGWVSNSESFTQWLQEQIEGTMSQQDLPLFKRLYLAGLALDCERLEHWDSMVIAMRETHELRHEERQRGRATMALLASFSIDCPNLHSQIAALAVFSAHERISLAQAMLGYAYSWLDSQVTAGIKLVPVGQTQAQIILYSLSDALEQAVTMAQSIDDHDIGYSSPALAMASSLHETQYCRLFRS